MELPNDYVYFIQADDGNVKIGSTYNLRERIGHLQVGSHHVLRCIAWCMVEDAEKVEAMYHRKFGASRIRGEWFRPSDELLEEVDRLREGATCAVDPSELRESEILRILPDERHGIFLVQVRAGWVSMKADGLESPNRLAREILASTGQVFVPEHDWDKRSWMKMIKRVMEDSQDEYEDEDEDEDEDEQDDEPSPNAS